MRGIFSGCSSLISLPDISKWNTSNINDMRNLFSKCPNLQYLSDNQNGIQVMLLIWIICLMDVHH